MKFLLTALFWATLFQVISYEKIFTSPYKVTVSISEIFFSGTFFCNLYKVQWLILTSIEEREKKNLLRVIDNIFFIVTIIIEAWQFWITREVPRAFFEVEFQTWTAPTQILFTQYWSIKCCLIQSFMIIDSLFLILDLTTLSVGKWV